MSRTVVTTRWLRRGLRHGRDRVTARDEYLRLEERIYAILRLLPAEDRPGDLRGEQNARLLHLLADTELTRAHLLPTAFGGRLSRRSRRDRNAAAVDSLRDNAIMYRLLAETEKITPGVGLDRTQRVVTLLNRLPHDLYDRGWYLVQHVERILDELIAVGDPIGRADLISQLINIGHLTEVAPYTVHSLSALAHAYRFGPMSVSSRDVV